MPVVLSKTGDSFDVVMSAQPEPSAPIMCASRSPAWAELARRTVEDRPACQCCRAITDLQVHHVLPVHVRPDLELDQTNLLVLCRRCHLFVGHLGDWSSWNVLAVSDASKMRKRIDERPTTRPRPVPIVSQYHTWENEMEDSMTAAFDAIMAAEDTVEVKALGVTHGGVLRGVMSELKVSGMPIMDIIRLIPTIVNMIVTVGPQVAEIVKKIRELWENK